MGRPKREFYTFIRNRIGKFYTVTYNAKGIPVVSTQSKPKPLEYNPTNLLTFNPQFGTNRRYNSLNRSVTDPLNFVLDGADILRSIDYTENGFDSEAFVIIVRYNPDDGIYYKYYEGKIDFFKKKDMQEKGFTVNLLDNSPWGVISQMDDVVYQINCSSTNPKAIKVIFDGVDFDSRYIYQPVATQMDLTASIAYSYCYLPFAMIAQDGDSVGIVAQTQSYQYTDVKPKDYVQQFPNNFIYRTQYPINVNFSGPYSFILNSTNNVGYGLSFYLWKSTDNYDSIFDLPADRLLYKVHNPGGIATNRRVSFNINQTFDLVSGEWVMILCFVSNYGALFGQVCNPKLTPEINNIVASSKTRSQTTTAYCLRPLDLLQELVNRATNGLFTIKSEFYTINNKKVLTCGDALRNAPLAFIYTSISEWFKSFHHQDYLAARTIDDQIWIEQNDVVYNQDNVILDIGEIMDLVLEQDIENIINSIRVGSRDQDYRHASGRFEFNNEAKFAIDLTSAKNELDLTTPYITGCYPIEFIRIDYQGGNSKDNFNDKSTFMVKITDEIGESIRLVENFIVINVNNSPLAPIIKYPLNNDVISNLRPRLKGIGEPLATINFYIDSALDGSTVIDSDGNWEYRINNDLAPFSQDDTEVLNNGLHVINATYTDESGAVDTLNLVITTDPTIRAISYPEVNDTIYNNKPLIKGVGQTGDTFVVGIDGITLGAVTCDESCKWEIQAPILANGMHTIYLDETPYLSFEVNSFTSIPLITSELDRFVEINNLPLVEGVGIPGVKVYLYLDYYSDVPIGEAIIDSNGNWSIQLVELFKSDGVAVLTPIPNGEHTISTALTIDNAPIKTYGYKLDRPDFENITGVPTDTVYNVPLSPKRSLQNWKSYFASLLFQNKQKEITFEKNEKNQSLMTVLNGVTTKENANIVYSELGLNFCLPIKAKFKAVVPRTFSDIFAMFNSGGMIRATSRGNELFLIPKGKMSVEDVSRNVQSWDLLLSRNNSLQTILRLSQNTLYINLMKNSISHHDYNSLHFVIYDYSKNPGVNNFKMYEEWFENRTENFRDRPFYVQKFQRTDPLKDQIMSNGVSDATLVMYRCSDAKQMGIFPYQPVNPSPIPFPDICQEVEVDLSDYPDDQYFFVITAGAVPVAISERIEVREYWRKTIAINAYGKKNKTGFCFSTGITSFFRIEGHLGQWQPDVTTLVNKDEISNYQMLNDVPSSKRRIELFNAKGGPDYLVKKVSSAIILDNLFIEEEKYVTDKDLKLEPVDNIQGYPMYSYYIDVHAEDNQNAMVVGVGEDSMLNSVVLVVNASAIGKPSEGVINIEIKE